MAAWVCGREGERFKQEPAATRALEAIRDGIAENRAAVAAAKASADMAEKREGAVL
jgi:hypothetical protein